MQAVLKAQINKTDRNDARGIVDSLKVLDPKRPIREADIADAFWHFRFVPLTDIRLRGVTSR